ncbi:MAG TPA: methylenetetrahydrofolate reductase [Xanthobacteraceae bacterium]|jgi:methylenetetrahydrofolate reductase (NADPH)|nr:methylenetetrahydrofolate reductase [Xanthobacteraceae bacterium]
MGTVSTLLAAEGVPDTVRRIAGLMRTASFEATRPSDQELAALAGTAPPGTSIYLSALPGRPHDAELATARKLRAAGFEPVPHLAARNFASVAAFEGLLARMAGEAGVTRVLVIAGDLDRPAGPFASALDVIERGLLQRHGIREVGIAAHPDGHPRLSDIELDRALAAKIDAAQQTDLGVHIVTQFCFDAAPVVAWLERLRELGLDLPVRIGLAGPTSLATLLRYAQRCGVKASAQGLARRAGLVKQMFSINAPDRIVRALATAGPERLGDVALHFFSFGGLAATARWAAAVSAGRIALESDGFEVAPPHPVG